MNDVIIWGNPPVWSGNSKPIRDTVAYGMRKGWIGLQCSKTIDVAAVIQEWAESIPVGDMFSAEDFYQFIDAKHGLHNFNPLLIESYTRRALSAVKKLPSRKIGEKRGQYKVWIKMG